MAYSLGYNLNNAKDVLTVDPGIHTGLVLWHYGVPLWTKTLKGNYFVVAEAIDGLLNVFASIPIDCAIIEGVDVRITDEISLASASRGNLSTLAYTVGAIAYVCQKHCKQVDVIRFIDWAGQLSYTQLRNILKKKFDFDAPNDHIAAAYGIGLWAKGVL